MRTFLIVLALYSAASLSGCSTPTAGPDKSLGGALLGAGWGAGAGAVVGNQVATTGQGMGVGAGIGAAEGLLVGAGLDVVESTQLEQERQLASLRMQNLANARELEGLQGRLDRAVTSDITGGVYQVFFDPDSSTLKAGAVANLEIIAEQLRRSPAAFIVNVVGNSDDAGTPDYNERLAEGRARTVSAYLASRGLSSDQIVVKSFGSKRPLASNGTPEGRQLNRRVDIYISR